MAQMVDKKIVSEAELDEYIAKYLNGWKKTKHDRSVNDMIFEKGKSTCFIYRWAGGYSIQRLEA